MILVEKAQEHLRACNRIPTTGSALKRRGGSTSRGSSSLRGGSSYFNGFIYFNVCIGRRGRPQEGGRSARSRVQVKGVQIYLETNKIELQDVKVGYLDSDLFIFFSLFLHVKNGYCY